MTITDSQINKSLKPILKNINDNNVTMNKKEAERNVKIMEETVDSLLTAMKNVDPLFNELFQKKVYTGSFYDRIRVKNPTEFDLNMVLSLPFAPGDVQVFSLANAPAFMQIRLKRSINDILSLHPHWTPNLYYKLIDFFEEKKLLRTKIQSWIQSVIARAMDSNEFKLPSDVKSIDMSRVKGPAFTYYIETTHDTTIDLDLVPVIDCVKYSLPSNINRSNRFNQLTPEAKIWFLVPKPYNGPICGNDNSDTYWRIAFPEAEKQLLKSEGCVKVLIKLLKLLRDHQNWHKIYSYCIKSLFLLELDKNSKKSDWLEADLGTLFMKMLRRLQTVVELRYLEYYFNHKANLLNGLDKSTSENITSRINKIITDVEKNPSNIVKYFPKL